MAGALIAFEGLDQSGKQTQAEGLRDFVRDRGRQCRLLSFPDYHTAIGGEISRALHGERDYAPDTMQLLYVANRYEKRVWIEDQLAAGTVIVCDRYVASTVAYGEAQGLDAIWLENIQRFLPRPDLTVVLDIAPETAVRRKATGRDRYERDLALLSRVRDSYRRQSRQERWLILNGERAKADVSADVLKAVAPLLVQP
ncbi:MAG: dTMP kinase [Acidobacteria bacterium]|nr:dTMP kinase [Acidobacteriota bacterium]